MKTATIILIVFAVALFVVGATCAERTPPGSFVKYRVPTVKALAQQIRQDPVARQRFAKHFGVPAAVVADRFENTLHMETIKTPMRTTMWYVNKDNQLLKKTKLLPKGTVVFADNTGKPVLAWSCGNPMVPRLNPPKAPVEKVVSEVPDEEIIKPFAPETVSGSAVTSEPVALAPIAAPTLASPALDAVTIPAIAAPPLLASADLGALGALAAAGSLAGFSGSQRSVPTPPVPEPPAGVVLALGSMLFGGSAYLRARLRRR